MDVFFVACLLLALLGLWGMWPLCWIVERKRTPFENIRIVLGALLLAIVAISLVSYQAVMNIADGFESH